MRSRDLTATEIDVALHETFRANTRLWHLALFGGGRLLEDDAVQNFLRDKEIQNVRVAQVRERWGVLVDYRFRLMVGDDEKNIAGSAWVGVFLNREQARAYRGYVAMVYGIQ